MNQETKQEGKDAASLQHSPLQDPSSSGCHSGRCEHARFFFPPVRRMIRSRVPDPDFRFFSAMCCMHAAACQEAATHNQFVQSDLFIISFVRSTKEWLHSTVYRPMNNRLHLQSSQKLQLHHIRCPSSTQSTLILSAASRRHVNLRLIYVRWYFHVDVADAERCAECVWKCWYGSKLHCSRIL